MNKLILKTLVGSQAHGLAGENSDFDYRGVFVVPTQEILKLGGSMKHTSWLEGKDDDTSWEVGHFLNLATHSNPTILETFLAPVVESDDFGIELRNLFPYIWSSKSVMDAFCGYGLNQRKKFLDGKDAVPNKFAVAYLRVLYQGWELLSRKTFTIEVSKTEIGNTLKRWKRGEYEIGEVIQTCIDWEKRLKSAYEYYPQQNTNIDEVNKFLLKVRKENW